MSRNILEPEPYVFDSDFEQLVVAMVCNRPAFWFKIGRELEPDNMPTEAAKIVLREVRMLTKETTKSPAVEAVRQRLTSRWSDGKFPKAMLDKCLRFTELRITGSTQDLEDNIFTELLPVIRKRYDKQVVLTAADEFAKGKGYDKTKDLIQRVEQVGADAPVADDADSGIDLLSGAGDAFDEIEALKSLDRMPLGIPMLDLPLGGGFWRGCCALLVAGTGDGKSMTMGHVCCTAIRGGRSVALASLEDNRPLYNARLTANLTGWEWEEVMKRPKAAEQDLRALKLPGRLRVKYFDPDTTTFEEIVQWAQAEHFDLLAVDYVDKVKSGNKKSEDSSYLQGRDVVQAMRKFAEREQKWLITGSQAKRRQERKRLLDNDDVAESMHKVRIPQLVITLNYDKETEEVTYVVSKNRMGRGRFEVGPEPHDWARGRSVPL